jgi:hypothetical protein
VSRLAAKDLAQLGERAESDRPGAAVLQDSEVRDCYPGAVRQFSQGHPGRFEQFVKVDFDGDLGLPRISVQTVTSSSSCMLAADMLVVALTDPRPHLIGQPVVVQHREQVVKACAGRPTLLDLHKRCRFERRSGAGDGAAGRLA